MKSFTQILVLLATASIASAGATYTPEALACKDLELIGSRLTATDCKRYNKDGGKGMKLYHVDLNACVANMGGQLKFEGYV